MFVLCRMAAVSGTELEERYGEEMRGWALAGKSWWDVRLALYEAHPELWGRVSDKCMRYWQGAHAGGRQGSYVRKRPAAVCEQGSMSDLAPLWSWGVAKIAEVPPVTYRGSSARGHPHRLLGVFGF